MTQVPRTSPLPFSNFHHCCSCFALKGWFDSGNPFLFALTGFSDWTFAPQLCVCVVYVVEFFLLMWTVISFFVAEMDRRLSTRHRQPTKRYIDVQSEQEAPARHRRRLHALRVRIVIDLTHLPVAVEVRPLPATYPPLLFAPIPAHPPLPPFVPLLPVPDLDLYINPLRAIGRPPVMNPDGRRPCLRAGGVMNPAGLELGPDYFANWAAADFPEDHKHDDGFPAEDHKHDDDSSEPAEDRTEEEDETNGVIPLFFCVLLFFRSTTRNENFPGWRGRWDEKWLQRNFSVFSFLFLLFLSVGRVRGEICARGLPDLPRSNRCRHRGSNARLHAHISFAVCGKLARR